MFSVNDNRTVRFNVTRVRQGMFCLLTFSCLRLWRVSLNSWISNTSLGQSGAFLPKQMGENVICTYPYLNQSERIYYVFRATFPAPLVGCISWLHVLNSDWLISHLSRVGLIVFKIFCHRLAQTVRHLSRQIEIERAVLRRRHYLVNSSLAVNICPFSRHNTFNASEI